MNKKLVIIIVSVFAVVALAVGGVGFWLGFSASDRDAKDDGDRNREEATTLHSDSQKNPTEENNPQNGTQNGSQSGTQSGNQSGTQSGNQGGTQSGDLASQLLGKWRDGAGMSGYEFRAGGKVTLTYIDLGFTGLDIFKGDVNGVYTLEGDKLTISTSVYAGTISSSYTASVSGDVLTLVSTDNGSTATYMRSADSEVGGEEPSVPESTSNTIIGKWADGAGMSGYDFKEDGTVSFTYFNFELIGYDTLSGDYTGTYTLDGNTVTISFSIAYGATITNSYTYEVADNTLKMTDEKGNVSTYIRQ